MNNEGILLLNNDGILLLNIMVGKCIVLMDYFRAYRGGRSSLAEGSKLSLLAGSRK